MKFVILFALVAAALAQEEVVPVEKSAFLHPSPDDNIEVLQYVHESPVGAVYNHLFELDNGIRVQETGYEGAAGQANAEGSYAFVSPDGTPVEITYTADENGFVAQGDAIPAIPAHAEEQVKIAAQQRAEGIEFDQRGFRI